MAWKLTAQQRGVECNRDEYVGNPDDTAETLPDDAPAGSVAFRADMSGIWIMAPDGEWTEV